MYESRGQKYIGKLYFQFIVVKISLIYKQSNFVHNTKIIAGSNFIQQREQNYIVYSN